MQSPGVRKNTDPKRVDVVAETEGNGKGTFLPFSNQVWWAEAGGHSTTRFVFAKAGVSSARAGGCRGAGLVRATAHIPAEAGGAESG